MKRKLFVGSSTEGFDIAKKVSKQISKECGDWINAETWKDGGVFTQNSSTLDSLIKASRKFDYGVLVASKDDVLKSRGKKSFVPRDNVMFEMGMFLGSLGLTRAFLLVEEESKLPTDYNGVSVSYFQRGVKGSLEKAIKKIILSIKNTTSTFNLKPVPSAALALGYFNNFIKPVCQKMLEQKKQFKLDILLPNKLKNISDEILAFQHKNPSNEVSVYGGNSRPIVHEFKKDKGHYWDVPTTLITLDMLIDLIVPAKEIGIDIEKQEWIEHELRSFAGTINILSNDNIACRGKINVESL